MRDPGNSRRNTWASHDGRYLMGEGGRLIDLEHGQQIEYLPGQSTWQGAVFKADTGILATGGDNNIIGLWSLAERRLLHRHTDLRHRVHALTFSPDGAFSAVSEEGVVRVWRATVPETVDSLEIDPNGGFSLRQDDAPSGNARFGNATLRTTRVYDPTSGIPLGVCRTS